MATSTRGFPRVDARRAAFPSLGREHGGSPLVHLDGPAGTQVPAAVVEAVGDVYHRCNANTHGLFPTSRESDDRIERARASIAEFLGAPDSRRISFGANMTTLAFSLSRAFARAFRPGDEVLITQLDHEANRGPWLGLRDRGVVVREIRIRPDATLDEDDFRSKVTERTRLVALGWASNAFGTVNDVGLARRLAHEAGAWLLVDAVHYAPHFLIDVAETGIDFLLCSAYKFYGPHVGILCSREGLLEQLDTDRLRTQDPRAPYRIETGTQNHAALAGVGAAVEYLASLGRGATLRERIVSAMTSIAEHERRLASRAYEGLGRIRGVRLHGPSFRGRPRAPTLAFTVRGRRPDEVSRSLGDRGICTWDGHFYAVRPMEVLGLLEGGGVNRVGICLYNTDDEVSRFLEEVARIARS